MSILQKTHLALKSRSNPLRKIQRVDSFTKISRGNYVI